MSCYNCKNSIPVSSESISIACNYIGAEVSWEWMACNNYPYRFNPFSVKECSGYMEGIRGRKEGIRDDVMDYYRGVARGRGLQVYG